MLCDEKGMIEDVSNLEDESVVLVHACAHNPTGVDPSKEMFSKLIEIVKKKNLLLLIDAA